MCFRTIPDHGRLNIYGCHVASVQGPALVPIFQGLSRFQDMPGTGGGAGQWQSAGQAQGMAAVLWSQQQDARQVLIQ